MTIIKRHAYNKMTSVAEDVCALLVGTTVAAMENGLVVAHTVKYCHHMKPGAHPR